MVIKHSDRKHVNFSTNSEIYLFKSIRKIDDKIGTKSGVVFFYSLLSILSKISLYFVMSSLENVFHF